MRTYSRYSDLSLRNRNRLSSGGDDGITVPLVTRNLKWYFDASNVKKADGTKPTTLGDKVATLVDTSVSQENFIQNTDSKRATFVPNDAAINNRPSIEFTAANVTEYSPANTTFLGDLTDCTFMFVGYATVNGGRIFYQQTPGGDIRIARSNGIDSHIFSVSDDIGTLLAASVNIGINEYHVWTNEIISQIMSMYKDGGTAYGTDTDIAWTTATPISQCRLGAGFNSGNPTSSRIARFGIWVPGISVQEKNVLINNWLNYFGLN